MFKIVETATGWEIQDGAGVVLAKFEGEEDSSRLWAKAVAWLGDNSATLAPIPADAPPVDDPNAGPPAGVLAERWQAGPQGIVLAEPTGDGRDFTGCTFTWRQTVAPLPLMFLSDIENGHFGAELAGFIDTQGDPLADGQVQGWFHDTDQGRNARDVLVAQGAFAVSVDPGMVEATFVCTEEEVDEWGSWCIDGVLTFQAYEIAGLTMVPFPGFGNAAIVPVSDAAAPPAPEPVTPSPVDGQVASAGRHPSVAAALSAVNAGRDAPAAPVVASTAVAVRPDAVIPARVVKAPRAEFLTMTEPIEAHEHGEAYVPQRDGQIGIPLRIDAETGHVFGHAALWGTCHVGIQGECVTPPPSEAAYAHFHLGHVTADDGKDYATGPLTAGCDHAAIRMRAAAARDHYAHNGVAWADVRASNGVHGVWLSGVLRPDVTPEQVRVLRAGSLSGDWRDLGVGLELIGVLAVNVPGFPIIREALAASGLEVVGDAKLEWAVGGGRQTALIAAGMVRPDPGSVEALVAAGTISRCENCGRRGRPAEVAVRPADLAAFQGELRAIRSTLTVIEQRTRPSKEALAAAASDRRARLRPA